MAIHVNDKYKLKADNLNFIVLENKPVQDTNSNNYGKDNWVTVAYCSDIKHCLRFLVDKEVFDTELSDLKTILNAIESLKEDINRMNI